MNCLTIRNRVKLTKAQKSLFDLIVQKVKDKSVLEFDEIKEIYIKDACRDVRDGIPYYYDNWEEDSKNVYKPMKDWQIKQYVTTWLSLNIGLLVLKGHLKIIPVFDWEG